MSFSADAAQEIDTMTIRYDVYVGDEFLFSATSAGLLNLILVQLKDWYPNVRVEQHKQKGKVQS